VFFRVSLEKYFSKYFYILTEKKDWPNPSQNPFFPSFFLKIRKKREKVTLPPPVFAKNKYFSYFLLKIKNLANCLPISIRYLGGATHPPSPLGWV
jgi:hypothetical protein